MKKNQTIILILALFTICAGLSCGSADSKSAIENGNGNTIANRSVSGTPKSAPVDCPTTPISVSATKDKGLEKYEGCQLSVRGKIWDVRRESITLIDEAERTDYNYSLFIGGNFTDSRYSDIGLKISKLKIDQQLDRLPVATFTGTVEKVSGYTSLKNSVLTNVQ